jgi:hypothetical protein
VALRCVVIAKDFHRAYNLDSRGVDGNNHYALLPVWLLVIRITLAQDQVKLRPGISSTTDPPLKALVGRKTISCSRSPFMTIYDNLVSLFLYRSLNVGGI